MSTLHQLLSAPRKGPGQESLAWGRVTAVTVFLVVAILFAAFAPNRALEPLERALNTDRGQVESAP